MNGEPAVEPAPAEDRAVSGSQSARASAREPGIDPSHTASATLIRAALIVVGAAGIGAWLVLAVVHLGDRFRIGHVQGHWMALAQYAARGELYPPLSDGVRFGGTRHMPVPILMHAGASRVTGEYLRSGKSVALLSFAILLGIVFIVLRGIRCPAPLAIALTGMLPATNAGLLAGSAPGGDVLPLVLQLAALLAAATALRSSSTSWLFASGVLAGLATSSKLTGLWAALAISGWLTSRCDWRRLAWFSVATVGAAGLVLGLVQYASQGRFLATLLTLTFEDGTGLIEWVRAPNRLVFFAVEDATAVWMIVPLAALGTLAAWRSSELTLHHHALGWSLLIAIAVFTDIGTGLNQLLDPAVLTIIAVGLFASSLTEQRLGQVSLATALAFVVIGAGIGGVRATVPHLREAAPTLLSGQTPQKYTPRPLADIVRPGDTLLTDDPAIPVLLGQTPLVLDAFMLRRLDEVRPDVVRPLLGRIDRQEFDHVVLTNDLADDLWWNSYHLGRRVAQALRRTYVLAGVPDGYYLYRPVRR